MQQIGIVGIGNIGISLIKGLCLDTQKYSLMVYDRNENNNILAIKSNKNVKIASSDIEVIKYNNIIFLCVRTNQLREWINKNQFSLKNKTLILIQSGIDLSTLYEYFNFENTNIIRAITNINISERKGHTVILNNDSNDFEEIVSIFESIGYVIKVENEQDLDKISLVIGCTPAFVGFILTELSMTYNNIKLDDEDLLNLLSNVITNSIDVIKKQSISPNDYMNSVCTKGGTLEACIIDLQKNNIFKWLNPLKEKLKIKEHNENTKE